MILKMQQAQHIFTGPGPDTSLAIGHSEITGLAMLVLTCVALLLADRIRQRPLLILSASGVALGLAGLGSPFFLGCCLPETNGNSIEELDLIWGGVKP